MTAARSGGLEWGLGAEDPTNQLRRAVPLVANRHKSRNPKMLSQYCCRCFWIAFNRIKFNSQWRWYNGVAVWYLFCRYPDVLVVGAKD